MKVKKQIIQKRFTKIVSALLTIGLLPYGRAGAILPSLDRENIVSLKYQSAMLLTTLCDIVALINRCDYDIVKTANSECLGYFPHGVATTTQPPTLPPCAYLSRSCWSQHRFCLFCFGELWVDLMRVCCSSAGD